MDAYDLMRQEARAKRDRIIKAAREQYASEMADLRLLRRRITGERYPLPPERCPTILDVVRRVMPRDRAFTLSEVIRLIQEDNPARRFRPASVRSLFQQLLGTGEVRRLSWERGEVLWGASDCPVEPDAFGCATFTDMTERVLADGKLMRPPEIVTALRTIGYRANLAPKDMHDSVIGSLKRNPAKFERVGKRQWRLAGG
jgi:hypothetical protein